MTSNMVRERAKFDISFLKWRPNFLPYWVNIENTIGHYRESNLGPFVSKATALVILLNKKCSLKLRDFFYGKRENKLPVTFFWMIRQYNVQNNLRKSCILENLNGLFESSKGFTLGIAFYFQHLTALFTQAICPPYIQTERLYLQLNGRVPGGRIWVVLGPSGRPS